jgi:hypothetical protein
VQFGGLYDTETPDGADPVNTDTGSEKLLRLVRVIVELPEKPWYKPIVFGLADMPKSPVVSQMWSSGPKFGRKPGAGQVPLAGYSVRYNVFPFVLPNVTAVISEVLEERVAV